MYKGSGLFTIIFLVLLFGIIVDIFRLIFGLIANLSSALIPLILVVGVCYAVYKLVNDKDILNKVGSSLKNKKEESKDEMTTLFISRNNVVVNENIKVSKDGFYKGFGDLIIKYKNEPISSLEDLYSLYPATYLKLKENFVAISKKKKTDDNNDKSVGIKPNEVEERINNIEINSVAEVNKPQISDTIIATESRIETFSKLLINTSYGSNNSEYVKGHKKALIEQYRKAYDEIDLIHYEKKLSDTIANYSSQTLMDKGYYDGLIYTSKALKKTKELFLEKINRELEKEL